MNLWEVTFKGGLVMIPIALCGALTLAIIVEKIISLRRAEIDNEIFMKELEKILRRRKIKEALEFCEKHPQPVPRIIKEAILRSDRDRGEIKESIEDAAAHEIPYLERYLGILATIATIAPLLGLLGTVTGLIRGFMAIESLGGLVNPGDLARGIWEALVTTVGGLTVAIPAYIAYNYFASRVNNLILQMEKSTTRIMEIFFFLKNEDE